jgi:hypothetical protein
MPRKTFIDGDVLPASDLNNFLMNQSVMTFATAAARTTAIPTPNEGMVTYLESTESLDFYNGSAWAPVSMTQSGNYIINGGFDVWQRGTVFSSGFNSGLVYTADRWYFYNNGNGSQEVSRQVFFEPGNLPSTGDLGPFYLRNRIQSVGTTTGWIMEQRIEDVRNFLGKTVTISFYARSEQNNQIGVEFTQNFGTGGSADVTGTFVSSVSLPIGWNRYSYTVTLPSTSGKTINQNSYLVIRIKNGLSVSVGAIDIAGVQLEISPAPTPFRRNANSLQGELAACQRYYYRETATSTAFTWFTGTGIAGSSTAVALPFKTPVTLRATPTSVEFSTLFLSDTSNNYAVTAVTVDINSSPNNSILTVQVASGLTTFRPYYLRANNSTTAFIAVNAEI